MADTVRERFEAYFSNGGDWPQAIERNRYDGSYKLAGAESAWNTWQAAYAAAIEEAAKVYCLRASLAETPKA